MAIRYIVNPGGPTLGLDSGSGLGTIVRDGLTFKDLDRSGQLAPYKDWRNSPEVRAEDLAARLPLKDIFGLMMYSGHQGVPGRPGPFSACTYDGVPCSEAAVAPYALSDQQKEWIQAQHHRHFLLADIENTADTVKWVNAVQSLCEAQPYSIPMNIASDPRHGMDNSAEYNMGSGKVVSQWPEQIGLAATFDPDLVEQYGRVVAEEYRALGMTTALGPQIDLATEPRWSRMGGTFGPSPKLSAAMAKAVCQGYQTTPGAKDGWGNQSINAMPKHWPSGGPEEGGRDAHFAYGKYTVYPGNNFFGQMEPFLKGAFCLEGGTGCASAVMPYYTISWQQDIYGTNRGNSYSKYIIGDLLREKYGFDGVVCTDWGITMDPNPHVYDFAHTCWGAEDMEMVDRFVTILEAGVDQFGDVWDKDIIAAAYRKLCEKYGTEAAEARIRRSGKRLLKNMFQVGLFENPYVDEARSSAFVGSPALMEHGRDAQRKSTILLKNRNAALPRGKGQKVYIPPLYSPAGQDWFGNPTEETWFDPLERSQVEAYFTPVDTPEEADFALVCLRAPQTGSGYDPEDLKAGGNGYMPISLQYGPYTAATARETSIAGGDPREKSANRSYRGKTVTASNLQDLKTLEDTRRRMGTKPVIAVLQFRNPVVPGEFEPLSDAVIGHSGISSQVLLEAVAGDFDFTGRLPMQMPKNMETVEAHCEDLPFDLACYTDEDGHIWDFGYGLSLTGVLDPSLAEQYR